MALVVPRLGEALGTSLPGVVERASVVDRAGWIRANVGTFRSLISRMEDELLDQVVPEGGGLTRATMALANRWVTSQQLGFLLGFMGTRVLGQYDIAMLSAEAEDGRLLFVEENVRGTAHALGIPVAPFRTWIALHETTHAFEFEAHPWLRPYLAERLERQLSLFSGNASTLGRDTLRAIGRALRGEAGGEHWMESLMGDEQKRLFRETQAVMSLLEGFSDYIMDEVGRGLVPDVETISARFHERRQRRSGFERADPPADGHGPEAGAVRQGRAVRPGRRGGRAAGPRSRASGTGPSRCPRPRRSPSRTVDRAISTGCSA